jgi:hypothetical protein
MGEDLPRVKSDKVAFKRIPPANEQELKRQMEFDSYLAQLPSEMYTWLITRRFYRFHGDGRENP